MTSTLQRHIGSICKRTRYSERTGEYFDNDSGRFVPIHEAAINDVFIDVLIKELDRIVAEASLNSG